MPRPCEKTHLDPNQYAKSGISETPDQCHACWLFLNNKEYNRHWGGTGIIKEMPIVTLMTGQPGGPNGEKFGFTKPKINKFELLGPCVYLGQPTGEIGKCISCGQKEVALHHCSVFGECTTNDRLVHYKNTPEGKKLIEAAWCRLCKHYTPPDPFSGKEPLKNLIFHVYPVRGSGIWERNVEHLLKRINLFDGRRVVGVVTDSFTNSLNDVKAAFRGQVHEFFEMPNDPSLREVVTFEELFGRVETTSPNQVTFYCQAKGVTHPIWHPAHTWTDILYETNLDYWPLVLQHLKKYPTTGSFRVLGKAWVKAPDGPSESKWHYSGSFFWFRNKDLFSKPDWKRIDKLWTGIEPYISLHFDYQEAGCLFFDTGRTFDIDPKNWLCLYDKDQLNLKVLPQYNKWKQQNINYRTP